MSETSDPTKLDTQAVADWMSRHVPGFEGPVTATKFPGGQSNPTFRLHTPSGDYVLRRKPPGKLLKSAHAVDREYRVQSALWETDVPVAKMYALCEDESVIGSMFYVMEAIDAGNFVDPRLPALPKPARTAVFDEMNRVLAAIHDVDIDAVGLSDYGPEGNYFARQTGRWTKQYRASETDHIPDMEALIDWLPANMPDDDGQRTLVHGDFRLDNLLFAEDGSRCLAVLDWELSTIGHPYADLAAVIMQWQMPPGDQGKGLAGVDRADLGLPSDEAFIADYCRRRGIERIENFNFYLAFTFFRMAGIIQGVYKRALDGNASNPERGLAMGPSVKRFAQAGMEAARNG